MFHVKHVRVPFAAKTFTVARAVPNVRSQQEVVEERETCSFNETFERFQTSHDEELLEKGGAMMGAHAPGQDQGV
jgi:hypothetical protein